LNPGHFLLFDEACNKKRRGNGDDENGSVFFAKRQKSKRMKVSFPKFQK
jgi:hypothetical protein